MKINFNAGPAALPTEVLAAAAEAVIEYEGTGVSILSLAHRSAEFEAILNEARKLTLDLLGLDDSYTVTWFQGGGRLQFEMIPMNFLAAGETAAYIDSGHWAADAMSNVARYGKLHVAGSSAVINYRSVPRIVDIPEEAKYVHLTSNNTIYGTQCFDFPNTEVPLIADFSSELFSRRLDYSKFSLIYAVAQKNIGPAGVTLVVAKKEFIKNTVRPLADILSYKVMADKNSLVNTAPVFPIYVALLNLRYLASKGLAQIELENNEKAQLLYAFIDSSDFYRGIADKDSRSKMNVCFTIARPELEQELLDFAELNNITGIAGHRSTGGFRASLYNAISIDEVQELIKVLAAFEAGIKE